MNKNKKNVVVVFAKKPKKGKVKTRIARETSDQFAYEFARICLLELFYKINNSDFYDLRVVVDDHNDLSWFQNNFSIDGMAINLNSNYKKRETQSYKFRKIFSELLNKKGYEYEKAILIPMDVPFISEEDLISAFVRLDKKKYVFGPEINGGVYLIGASGVFKNDIFKGVRWSTSFCFEDLRKNCKKNNNFSLKLKNDLNMPQDIVNLKDHICYNCPILYDFLKEKGYYVSLKDKYIDFDDLSICIPVVSNIVERKDKKETEILIQTRYKPNVDPDNTGKIEIPSGLIQKYELAQEAAVRETKEETGIICRVLKDQQAINYITNKKEKQLAIYRPFCCNQQLRKGRAYISFVFISNYLKGELKENLRESRNPRWISLKKIEQLVSKAPENFFSLSLAALKEYLNYKSYYKN